MNFSHKSLFLIPLFLLYVSCSLASDLPEPRGFVNDFAGVLTGDSREKIENIIDELENKTGAELVIVTLDSISPYDEKEYARMLFEKWKPGKKGKDNGIIVLLAVKERLWRIETGYGIEGVLPDGLCGEIGRDYMVPYFKDGEYAQGLLLGTAKVANIIADSEGKEIEGAGQIKIGRKKEKMPVFLYVFIPFFFFLWNLPWPFFIGLPATMIFVFAFYSFSPLLGLLVLAGYAASLIVRYIFWKKIPKDKRKSFFGAQNYGSSGGFTGGGGSMGGRSGGSFGGGSSGGGGAGGRF